MLLARDFLVGGEIVGSCCQCNSHLCSFMMFMTGVMNVVKQYYDEVGWGRGGCFFERARRGEQVKKFRCLMEEGLSHAINSLFNIKIQATQE